MSGLGIGVVAVIGEAARTKKGQGKDALWDAAHVLVSQSGWNTVSLSQPRMDGLSYLGTLEDLFCGLKNK